ncbi:hypothetical protein CALVIDRAFT_565334 [Calocera viscosa TUFC12733]|uniref:Mediator of RNA polymerase II transcription subunit 17 n=1 Tax=Calocera viscosa (strain TUFC12733) TaxID=1330018 RepID=A0A167KRV8_CALVF|nr:hypothetical protein CALVIDRAFT_565334 [Calocera viscosa TUFC12733]
MATTTTATATATAARWRALTLLLESPSSGAEASRLLELSSEGEATYEPREDAAQRLTRELRALWARGDYAEITEEALRRELEEEQGGMLVDDDDDDVADEEEEEGIRPEELGKLKHEVLTKLHEAMQQTLTSQTLLALLQQSSWSGSAPKPPARPGMPPPPPPPIPLDGFPSMTATLTTPHVPAPATQLRRLQLSAGLKNASLRRTARVFDAGAEDIERGLEADAHYFTRALALREHWRLAPRAERGRRRGAAGKEPARDFGVYYGMEGAPLAQRAAAVAHLAPTAQGGLLFPSRTRRRLRVTLTALAQGSLAHLAGTSALELPEQGEEEESLNAQLRAAQREVLDHEVFSRLAREAMDLIQLSPTIRERLVSLRPLPELLLTFELVDPSDPPPATAAAAQHSPAVQLLSALLPLLHLPRTRPSLLQPLLKLLQYLQFCAQLSAQVARVAHSINSGVPTSVHQRLVADDGAAVWRALQGEDAWSLGGEVRLALAWSAPIHLSVSYPSNLILQTPRQGVQITSLPELGDHLSSEILTRLCAAFQRIGNRVLQAQAAGKAHEAEWTLGPSGKGWGEWPTGAVGFRVSLSPAFELAAQAAFSKRALAREGMSPATPGMGHLESVKRVWPEGGREEDMENSEGKTASGLMEWFEKGMKWVTEED